MELYQGRHCGCAPGTHAALTGMVEAHIPPDRRGSVLDFGAHAGALLLRLRDAGFSDLYGCDLDSTVFDVPGARFDVVELNREFASHFDERFDLVTATDVIEHLDSPRMFLSEVHKLVRDGGFIGITLPNVAFFEGRLKFLLRGELWGFGDFNYRAQRHINPITFEQMVLMMREIGFEVVACRSGGSFATPLRWVLTAPLWLPLRLLGGPTTLGESAIFLARKTEPDPELKQPTHYRSRWSRSRPAG